jgi:hypothetical protein
MKIRDLFITAAALFALSVGLGWVSTGFQSAAGWSAFLLVSVLAALLLAGGWLLIRGGSPPRWLAWLVIGASLLRLGMGVVWLLVLPAAGYDTDPELAGYVMSDAYDRDQAAWDLALSEKPLSKAYEGGYRKADQYGGLLYLSAAIYRYSGSSEHQPLLMVVLTAAFSSLAVFFIWAFAHRLWGDPAAKIAAWGLALYPEAVLMGSSQMREAFIITLAVAAAFGLLLLLQDKSWRGLSLAAVALLICLPISPPSAALLLVILIIIAAGYGRGQALSALRHQRWFWPALVLMVLLIGGGLWLALLQFAPRGVTSPFEVVTWWVKKSADWQAHLSEHASGWIQKIFDQTPEWTHLPLLLAYGITQPFLPAALIDISGAPVWRAIAIWRALGWTFLLPFLLYAHLRALRKGSNLERALCLAAWLAILGASFRGGGDAWDNPRYRLAFAGIQIALLAWVWAEQRRLPDPWLRRVLIGGALALAWFVPWYLRRYLGLAWPVADLFRTVGLGIASTILFWIGDIAKEGQRPKAQTEP